MQLFFQKSKLKKLKLKLAYISLCSLEPLHISQLHTKLREKNNNISLNSSIKQTSNCLDNLEMKQFIKHLFFLLDTTTLYPFYRTKVKSNSLEIILINCYLERFNFLYTKIYYPTLNKNLLYLKLKKYDIKSYNIIIPKLGLLYLLNYIDNFY